jgi:ubiquinone/menaquinone biosynthesis C-methylase UbiE
MKLLPQDQLVKTSRVDHAEWHYRPLLSFIVRRRFTLALSLLPPGRVHRMLEVGYGSGIFMPELAQRCEELYGIDIHSEAATVQARLEQCGVRATLSRQDAANTDFPDGFFDTIVSLSALEFIERMDEAAYAFARVLRPNGRLVAVMPAKSAFLDFALRAVTGEDAQRDYGDRRERVLPALLRYFRIERKRKFAPIYNAYEFAPLPPNGSSAAV